MIITTLIPNAFRIFKEKSGVYVLYTFLYFLISSSLSIVPFLSILADPFIYGIYIATKQRNEDITISTFFKITDKYKPLLAFAFISRLFLIIPVITYCIYNGIYSIDEFTVFIKKSSSIYDLYFFIGLIVSYFIFSPFIIFVANYILFEDIEVKSAFIKSFNLVKDNYTRYFAINIVLDIIAFSGIFLCCIGIVATLPIGIITTQLLYEQTKESEQ